MKIRFIAVAITVFLYTQYLQADLLVLPLSIDEIDSATTHTINELFFEAYRVSYTGDLKADFSSQPCRDYQCAIAAASDKKLPEVVYAVARKLGKKWIVNGYRYRTDDTTLLASAQLDSRSIEDFEFVTRRLA